MNLTMLVHASPRKPMTTKPRLSFEKQGLGIQFMESPSVGVNMLPNDCGGTLSQGVIWVKDIRRLATPKL